MRPADARSKKAGPQAWYRGGKAAPDFVFALSIYGRQQCRTDLNASIPGVAIVARTCLAGAFNLKEPERENSIGRGICLPSAVAAPLSEL
jgi:hypothetical protein